MGYVSREEAQAMRHDDLVEKFMEKQTMAAVAIAEAITVGGIVSEKAILDRYESQLPAHDE